jgi:hypothetical protein
MPAAAARTQSQDAKIQRRNSGLLTPRLMDVERPTTEDFCFIRFQIHTISEVNSPTFARPMNSFPQDFSLDSRTQAGKAQHFCSTGLGPLNGAQKVFRAQLQAIAQLPFCALRRATRRPRAIFKKSPSATPIVRDHAQANRAKLATALRPAKDHRSANVCGESFALL